MRLSRWMAVAALSLSLGPSAPAQTGAGFFRIVTPFDTGITGYDGNGNFAWTSAVAGVTGAVQRATSLAAESNWTNHVWFLQTGTVWSLRIDPDMALIPAGSFSMGSAFAEGLAQELPVHSVSVSAFYMDKFEVTKAKWDEVRTWATANGYAFDNAGASKASTHPVQTINWYDCVKWCNARSQKDGLTPVYFTDAGLTLPYKTGTVVPTVNWSASGYRLPTEAEWEKAARGGSAGRRFPWTDTDFIDHGRANYMSVWSGGIPIQSYDKAATSSYNPSYATVPEPYTSPAGSFAANGYGLYDMAGNVWEWCWDWYSATYYTSSPATDPRGETSGTSRALRGGSWGTGADTVRCSNRIGYTPGSMVYRVGFRCARGLHARLTSTP